MIKIKQMQHIMAIIKLAGIHFVTTNIIGCFTALSFSPVTENMQALYMHYLYTFVSLVSYICIVPIYPIRFLCYWLSSMPLMSLLCPTIESLIWGLIMYVTYRLIIKNVLHCKRANT